MTLYLASQSPRRQQLLAQIGISPVLLVPEGAQEMHEAEVLEATQAGEPPRAYVQRVTAAKLAAARARHAARGLAPGAILCTDTTVALRGRILGKPADAAAASATLSRLSGRTHQVYTAVALWDGHATRSALSASSVRVAALPPEVIAAYVASGEPFGKAGAYAIQGALAGWIEQVHGSHSGIMGLPLYETAQLLHAAGLLPLPSPR